MIKNKALLALEDGSLFWGTSIGFEKTAQGEVVFNTSMTGYQEILTDPSYYQQIVTLTYPHIGNVGTNNEDEESPTIYASGLIIRDLPTEKSNWRSRDSLSSYLKKHCVPGIADIDTRRLTRLLRSKGALNGAIAIGDIDVQHTIEAAQQFPGMKGMDLAKVVSTQKPYAWNEGTWTLSAGYTHTPPAQLKFDVIAYDFGIKRNILRILTDLGCRIQVVPATTPASYVLEKHPAGVFLSNGPGDPEPCQYAIEAIQEFVERGVPTFGICLGHQLLGLACGAKTIKMKFGHHGANHPVQDLHTKKVMISSQNHGFAVDEATLPKTINATHRSLFDQSLQGIHHATKPAFGFQGHPEASPGPQDLRPLFRHFIELMETHTY